MDDVIQIASFQSAADAQMYLALLQEADVAAFLTGEQTAGAFSGILPLGPQVHLFVARADAKRAADILNEAWGEKGDEWVEEGEAEAGYYACPKCGDAVSETETACPSCGTPWEDHAG